MGPNRQVITHGSQKDLDVSGSVLPENMAFGNNVRSYVSQQTHQRLSFP